MHPHGSTAEPEPRVSAESAFAPPPSKSKIPAWISRCDCEIFVEKGVRGLGGGMLFLHLIPSTNRPRIYYASYKPNRCGLDIMEACFSGGEDEVLEPVLKSLLYVNVEIENKS